MFPISRVWERGREPEHKGIRRVIMITRHW